MKVINSSYEIIGGIDRESILSKLELCGRICYKSEDKIGDFAKTSKFIKSIVGRGHHSVIEHVSITVKFITDRAVTHELVRHRVASYSQESQRYINYTKGVGEVTYVRPCTLMAGSPEHNVWENYCRLAETGYFKMIDMGLAPEVARGLLPNSCKTEIVMTANLREWVHVLKLRTSNAAHPDIRDLMRRLQNELSKLLPEIFEEVADGTV